MAYSDLDNWWASLPVHEKERIARKALTKAGKTILDTIIYYAVQGRGIKVG